MLKKEDAKLDDDKKKIQAKIELENKIRDQNNEL